MAEPEGRWMHVDFWGLLPEGADPFPPGDYLDVTGRLAELFGFTGLAHLTVREAKAATGPAEAAIGMHED